MNDHLLWANQRARLTVIVHPIYKVLLGERSGENVFPVRVTPVLSFLFTKQVVVMSKVLVNLINIGKQHLKGKIHLYYILKIFLFSPK